MRVLIKCTIEHFCTPNLTYPFFLSFFSSPKNEAIYYVGYGIME